MTRQASEIPGRYVVDSGAPDDSEVDLPQTDVDKNGYGIMYFDVPGRENLVEHTLPSVDFGDLSWVEPHVTAHLELVSVALLTTSWSVGKGALLATMQRVGSEGGEISEHWRIEIDESSISGPPVHFVDESEPPPYMECSQGRGAVLLHKRSDGAVTAIDLWLKPSHPPHRPSD